MEAKSNSACLTRFLRLEIYSFFELKESVLKLSRLSKRERKSLVQSEIAKKGKRF